MSEPLVVWDDKFSVGIAEIDRQHKSLIDFTNELFDACRTAGAEDVFRTTVRKAVAYVKTHFAYEEALMRVHGYPDMPVHKLEHEEFVRQILQKVSDYEEGRPFVANAFVRFLKDWYLNHIAISDFKYRKFFSEKGVR
jgi:hemerythrin